MRNIVVIVSCLVFLVGCKTSKNILKNNDKEDSRVAGLIEEVEKTQPQFKTANVSKMAVSFNINNREVNVSASCKIKKDSLIHLSIQPFMGIEMFKAEFTTDSIRVIDKMNHKYYVVDYAALSSRFGVTVDYYSIQNLLFNQFFCIGRKTVLVDSCKLVPLPKGKNSLEYKNSKMTQKTELSSTNAIEKVTLEAIGTPYQLNVDYREFTNTNGTNFPLKIAILISNQRSNVSSVVSILKIDFNTQLKFTAGNTDKYSRSDINLLLKKQ
jgi:hypothetical protein